MDTRVAAAKQRVVLAALLLGANRPVGVDELAEAAWGTCPPKSARVTMQNYIKRLRIALGDDGHSRIVTGPRGYEIRVDPDELDVARFETLLCGAREAARKARWSQAADQVRAALSVWRGEPLTDVPSDVLQTRERPRLVEMHAQAFETRIDADLHLGRHSEVIVELRQFVAAKPLRERPREMLMLALYRDGRQAEALAAYQHARRTLVGELGIEPGPAMRDLHERILAADPSLTVTAPTARGAPLTAGAAAVVGPRAATASDSNGHELGLSGHGPADETAEHIVPRQLPAAVRHFAGRQAELRMLADLLGQNGIAGHTVVISAIAGTAGVGKTALALHFAHRASGRFPDGQLYVNLRGFDPSGDPVTPGEAVRSFLDALRVPPDQIPAGLDAQCGLYRSSLAGRRMLIMLDNAADAAQVRPLLPGGGGCMVVVTSRRQLTALAAAVGAHQITLDVLTDAEAHELLARRLGADRLAAEPAAVQELTALCARLPLALSIAAARAAARPRFPLAALAAELRDARGRLDALDGGEAAANVRAVFSWSCDHLSPATVRMFRLLGLHPGPDISAPAAASLAGVSRGEARHALAELTASFLLAEHTPGRFAFHDLLRAYAAEQAESIDDEADGQAAIHRAADHYLHTARAAQGRLYPARQPHAFAAPQQGVEPEEFSSHAQALAWFDTEHQVLLGMINLAAARGLDTCAWQLPWAMETFVFRRGHWQDWEATQRIGLAAASRLGDHEAQAVAHRGIANACLELGLLGEADHHFAEALRIRDVTGDLSGQARLQVDLARLRAKQGKHHEALHHDRAGLELFRAVGQRTGEGDALSGMAWDLCQVGDYENAVIVCQQALRIHREIGNRHQMGTTWDTLGYAHRHLRHHAEAAACYHRAIDVLDELGHRYSKAVTLTYAGDAYQSAGDADAAREAWQQALAIFEEVRHPDAAEVKAKLRHLEGSPR
ncbi:MAG: AfsR/SARP family transcriptional regulator [Micromonosporaceae bacterium]